MKKFTAKTINSLGCITVVVDGQVYTLEKSHLNYSRCLDAFKKNNVEDFLKNVNIIEKVQNAVNSSSKEVSIRGDVVYYDDQPLHTTLTKRMISLLREGHDIQPLVNFLKKLMKNPSKNSIDQLYKFMEQENLPLTPDGDVLAYKAVRSDYYDKYSGKILNTPGLVIKMERNKVDDQPNNHCSHGYHVGGLKYSGPNGWYNNGTDKTIIVKFNPMNAVSVPNDHNFTKLRVCEYETVCDFRETLNAAVYSGKNVNHETFNHNEYSTKEVINEDNSMYLNVYTLVDGDCISFDYENKRRYLDIEDIDFKKDLVIGRLLHPEYDVNHYRSFKMSQMERISYHY